jgi:hypothetical protein
MIIDRKAVEEALRATFTIKDFSMASIGGTGDVNSIVVLIDEEEDVDSEQLNKIKEVFPFTKFSIGFSKRFWSLVLSLEID